jgi:hypothetical protein
MHFSQRNVGRVLNGPRRGTLHVGRVGVETSGGAKDRVDLTRGVRLSEPMQGSRSEPQPKPRAVAAPGSLSQELSGDLPCVRCEYNLKGLTVRGMCPECGMSIRTTLLAVVDPMAREFRRIEFPRLVAYGVVLWSWAAVVACLIGWALQAGYLLGPQSVIAGDVLQWLEWTLVGSVTASGVGAIALVRPHGGLPWTWRVLALLGVVCYGPLLWALLDMLGGWGPTRGGVFASETMHARAPFQLIGAASGIGILICLRPNAQALQARWLLMRIGAVTRQTMLAMVAVLLLWILAAGLVLVAGRLKGGEDEVLRMVAKLLILVGGIFLTVGVVSMALDCWRIRAVVLRPPLAMDEVLGRVVRPGQSPGAPQGQRSTPVAD